MPKMIGLPSGSGLLNTFPSDEELLSTLPRLEGVVSGLVKSLPCKAVIRRIRDSSSMASYPFRSGKGAQLIGTVEVLCLGAFGGDRGERGRRRRKQRRRTKAAIRRPAKAAPIAIPTIAPVGRTLPDDGAGVAVPGVVELEVGVGVVVMMGGRGRVGGMLRVSHPLRSDERQQNEVALGDVRPQ